ncbi:hypothetical protein DLAC_11536 [Tieghemostelium lacteum]|uniref:Uncharacterized protein n=1 Tax=Tieghemostelium lacteum TaxID=361077 RepID=A0A152A405_TIELA|nr:hypothetical protein DLAC_11536 [Tieghemostelium lacteum]|eukprot:KYR00956.1 hypothetical protein DLAC_11536 [Tieghemostelium lacteum]
MTHVYVSGYSSYEDDIDSGCPASDSSYDQDTDNLQSELPPDFICQMDGDGGKGSYTFEGSIDYDQIVTCTKYASGSIVWHMWDSIDEYETCEHGGSLIISANMVNFSCHCTQKSGCQVSKVLSYAYTTSSK